MQTGNSFKRALMLSSLTLLLASCAASSPPISQQSAEPAKIPRLPPEARVSQVPIPSICLPSCTAGLTKLREQSASMLTISPSAAPPANAPPMDYSLPPSSWPKR